jgi:ribosomal protein L5
MNRYLFFNNHINSLDKVTQSSQKSFNIYSMYNLSFIDYYINLKTIKYNSDYLGKISTLFKIVTNNNIKLIKSKKNIAEFNVRSGFTSG